MEKGSYVSLGQKKKKYLDTMLTLFSENFKYLTMSKPTVQIRGLKKMKVDK